MGRAVAYIMCIIYVGLIRNLHRHLFFNHMATPRRKSNLKHVTCKHLYCIEQCKVVLSRIFVMHYKRSSYIKLLSENSIIRVPDYAQDYPSLRSRDFPMEIGNQDTCESRHCTVFTRGTKHNKKHQAQLCDQLKPGQYITPDYARLSCFVTIPKMTRMRRCENIIV
jgi:hypothetical protein